MIQMGEYMTINKVKIIATGLVLSLITLPVYASDDSTANVWKKSLMADFTTTQTAYSDSWTGGEAGAINWVGNLNASFSKKLKPWLDFQTTLKLSFGQTITQNAETKKWSKPHKSTDLIDWENVGRVVTHKVIDPYAAFRVESQFVDASVEEMKRYLTPIKLTESVGVARRFYEKDKDQITSRFGLALRQILTSNITDTILFLTETSTITDGGLESVTDIVLTLNERLNYTGKITLFKALFNSKSDDLKGAAGEDYWRAIDLSWENIVSASLSKIVTVNLYTQLLYDKELSLSGRFKETLGIGFVYKMF